MEIQDEEVIVSQKTIYEVPIRIPEPPFDDIERLILRNRLELIQRMFPQELDL